MEPECCKEYTMGFCPNEEFYIEKVTEKCPLAHVSAYREEHKSKNGVYPFEYDILEYYKEIIGEVERKINFNELLLKNESIDQKYLDAFYECERLIEMKRLEDFDFLKTHSLLVIHGKLIRDLKNTARNNKLEVCRICSSFKEIEKPCEHDFCKKYEKLRNIVRTLDFKLPKRQNFIE